MQLIELRPSIIKDPLERSLLLTLAYFDVFRYPLTIGEIERFRPSGEQAEDIHACLDRLIKRKLVFRLNDHYSLQPNPLNSYRRKEGNIRAIPLVVKAQRIGRFLYRFPFVKAVGISGSLSKDFAAENADLDFFIITTANRLWIARTILHLYKKLALLAGKGKYYCMNYFLDENAMELDDRNMYTAIELRTLLPVAGTECFCRLFESNAWVEEHLPNAHFRKQKSPDPASFFISGIIEGIFKGKWGEKMDNMLFRISARRWQKKLAEGKTNEKGELMYLLTDKHFAKSDPGHFQEKILEQYNERIKSLFI